MGNEDIPTALIVDDEPRHRRFARAALESVGFQCAEASDGAEAVAVAARLQPTWILMDIEMRPMDGLTALAHIAVDQPDTRVIMMSQYDGDAFRAESLRLGATAFLPKQDLNDLTALMQSIDHEMKNLL